MAGERVPPAPGRAAGYLGGVRGGRRLLLLSVVEQVAQGEQAAAGALQDRDAGRAQPGGGGGSTAAGSPASTATGLAVRAAAVSTARG